MQYKNLPRWGGQVKKKKLDLETDLETVASVTSNDPRLTFDPIT